jgi:hypothetical protein
MADFSLIPNGVLRGVEAELNDKKKSEKLMKPISP